jgi:hypothetical protein
MVFMKKLAGIASLAAAATLLGGCGVDRKKGEEQFAEALRLAETDGGQTVKLLESSCDNEYTSACALLASIYIDGYRGFEIKADRSKAVKFAQKLNDIYIKDACEGKNKQACAAEKSKSAGLRGKCADKESPDCAVAIKLLSLGW